LFLHLKDSSTCKKNQPLKQKNMDKSTPIAHIRRSQEEQDEDPRAVVDNIVDDIEGEMPMGGAGAGPGVVAGAQDPRYYADDKDDERQPPYHPPPQQQRAGYGYPKRMPQPGVVYRGGGPGGGPTGAGAGPSLGIHDLENMPFGRKLMYEAKEPLLVAVLVVILSSGQIDSLIRRFLPMAQTNPLIGLLVRAAVAGAAFYLLRRFIPS
jgi:hypothetical protein